MENIIKNFKVRYILNDAEAQLHISKGNSKIGKTIYNFSTLPGNENNLLQLKDGTLLTNVPGTCSKHCENCFHSGCYAVNSARLHSNVVIKAWGENTLLLRKGIIWDKIDSYINKNQKKIKLWRINVSGEIGSVQEFEKWNNIAAKYPQIQFGLYTKNYEDLDLFMQKH